ncbi:MAG TPA: DUF465 domain-containing protein [Sphingomicrobium sp.]|nr:DUF465 domain-containing protein [Sphingomicrobium sp.]
MNDDLPIPLELEALKAEHRRLDEEITARIEAGSADQIEIARLKKEKLRLKDWIQRVVDLRTPDIIA